MRPAHNKTWQDNRADRIAPPPSKVLDVSAVAGVAEWKAGECRRLIGGRAGDEALSGRLAAGGSHAAIRGCGAPLRAFQGRRQMPRIISLNIARDRPITQASFRASRSFAIAARSGSDATILRSLRRTPLSRHSLIFAIASPRIKLPNSAQKRPSRRITRVQKRFRTFAIFTH
jgi:hypothetical protein